VIPIIGGTLDHDGEALYWELAGEEGLPTLALCHGAGGNHASWYQQVPHFADRYRVLTWDHRGFGMSTDRAERSGPEVAVGDLAALLDHVGAADAHLVGQSMGGWTVLGFTLRHPERVRSLTLADSLGGCPVPGWLERAAVRRPEGGMVLGRHVAFGPHLRDTDPTKAYLYQQLSGMGRSFGAFIPASIGRGLSETVHDPAALAEVACPVLCIVGADDAIFSPEWMREVTGFLPTAELEVIELAGHSPYFEQPDAWNRVLDGFLSSVPTVEARS
jgi:2-succinyl-6-hydroxy-2,4-cyclohexadiene-1-carboxylate synthase